MPVEDTDGAPDVSLELCNGRVDRIPEVDLVSQLGEGGQEGFDGCIWTGRNEVLGLIVNHCFRVSAKTTTYRNGERDDAREDVRTSASSLPADGATPVVSSTAQCINIRKETCLREKRNEPDASGFSGHLGVFEDTHQVIDKVSHSGRTLSITGMT